MADPEVGPLNPDAGVLDGVRARRSVWRGVLAVCWAGLAVAHLVAGDAVQTIVWGLGAGVWGLAWWATPATRVRSVEEDALVLREGLRTRRIPRKDVVDVRPEYRGGYGLVVSVRDGDPVPLQSTALRASVSAEQAAVMRRWAGLPD